MKKKKLKKGRREKIMSTSSDSAEEIVRLSLEGVEVIARLTGSMAKEMAVLLYAMAKDSKKQSKGQTRLNNLLKSNSNLRIFTLKKEDFQDFKKQAKRYGVLYSALYKKGEINKDGIIDILVREEDAVRVNRIIERFELTTVDQTKVETVLENAEIEKNIPISEEKTEIQKEIQERNTSEDLINKLLKKQNIKEENENVNPSNIQNTEKDIPSENLLKTNEKTEGTKKEEKSSIREQIEEIKKQNEEKQKVKEETKEDKKEENKKETKHKQPKKKNRKKERNK